MIAKKYFKSALKQAVIITVLLGVIPLLLALGQDLWGLMQHKTHELLNLNDMMKGLVPTNPIYVNLLLWLSCIYVISLIFIVNLERSIKRTDFFPQWLKNFLLNFEYAISAVFTVMFMASSAMFTLGFFLLFTSLSISNGLGLILIGLFIFLLATWTLAMTLELKDAFLNA